MKTNYLDPKSLECGFAELFAECGTMANLNAVGDEIMEQFKAAFNAAAAKFEKVAKTATKSASKEEKTFEEWCKEQKSKKTTKKTTKKTAKETVKKTAESTNRKERAYKEQIAINDAKAIKALKLKLQQYSERSFILVGDSKPLADYLRNKRNLKYRPAMGGWLVPLSKVEIIKNDLNIK